MTYRLYRRLTTLGTHSHRCHTQKNLDRSCQ